MTFSNESGIYGSLHQRYHRRTPDPPSYDFTYFLHYSRLCCGAVSMYRLRSALTARPRNYTYNYYLTLSILTLSLYSQLSNSPLAPSLPTPRELREKSIYLLTPAVRASPLVLLRVVDPHSYSNTPPRPSLSSSATTLLSLSLSDVRLSLLTAAQDYGYLPYCLIIYLHMQLTSAEHCRPNHRMLYYIIPSSLLESMLLRLPRPFSTTHFFYLTFQVHLNSMKLTRVLHNYHV